MKSSNIILWPFQWPMLIVPMVVSPHSSSSRTAFSIYVRSLIQRPPFLLHGSYQRTNRCCQKSGCLLHVDVKTCIEQADLDVSKQKKHLESFSVVTILILFFTFTFSDWNATLYSVRKSLYNTIQTSSSWIHYSISMNTLQYNWIIKLSVIKITEIKWYQIPEEFVCHEDLWT